MIPILLVPQEKMDADKSAARSMTASKQNRRIMYKRIIYVCVHKRGGKWTNLIFAQSTLETVRTMIATTLIRSGWSMIGSDTCFSP
jgi:hypothetical protein